MFELVCLLKFSCEELPLQLSFFGAGVQILMLNYNLKLKIAKKDGKAQYYDLPTMNWWIWLYRILDFFPLGNKYLMLDPFYFFPSVPKSSVQEMTC